MAWNSQSADYRCISVAKVINARAFASLIAVEPADVSVSIVLFSSER